MVSIIQDYIRKINSALDTNLSWPEVISITSVFLVFSCGAILLGVRDIVMREPVIYHEGGIIEGSQASVSTEKTGPILASKNGKAYFFAWCQGTAKIKQENRIYFANEDDAKASGRNLSKTCK